MCSGSLTVSARLLSALRIWLAATEVEVFSKACTGEVNDEPMRSNVVLMVVGGRKKGI